MTPLPGRRRHVAVATAVLATALAVSACSSGATKSSVQSAASNAPSGKQASGSTPGASAPKAGNAAPSTPGAPAPVGAAPAAPGGKANYASDKGVSADTIRIGTINMTSATRSLGPAIAGVQEQNLDAAVKYVNRNGGVAGRNLQLVTCDDGGDIARGRACYEKLKDNVFALVPSITWLTDVIHDRLPKDKVPWLSWGWFKSEYEDPWMFPCHANGMREATAVAEWTPGLDRVTCLFAGSVEHLMRDLFTPRQRAFYQFGGFHALAPIDVEDWRVGLVDRFAEDGCTVTPDALARLIELGEGHPRATMLVAQQTHDAAIADGTHVVDSGWWPSGWHQPWLPTGSLTNL